MQKDVLNIKNKAIGTGRPLICVPVMAEKADEIISQVIKLAQNNTQMIEWRVDAFEEAEDVEKIKAILEEIAKVIKDSILVYTYRSKAQGGLGQGSSKDIYDIHMAGAGSKAVDFVDVEFFASEYPDREIKKIHELGSYVIASHHDFDKTPDQDIIRMLLEKMAASGTDIVKLAVMPQSMEDVLLLLSETNYFHTTYPNRPLITMSMGKMGSVSRIAGEYFGSCVTFGAGEEASAPGQFPAGNLDTVLSLIHESIGD